MLDYLKTREEIDLDPPPYGASVLADSIAQGVRLTTLCIKIPRFELAAFNTHRVFSRNSSSSRAIPVKKRIEMVLADPYIPLEFGKNKSGMQHDEEVADADRAEEIWRAAMSAMVDCAKALQELGLHKQLANRLLEPWAWQTIIVTATEWANWEALRISEHAQGEIAKAARNMKAAMDASTPAELGPGQWHLPLAFRGDIDLYRGMFEGAAIAEIDAATIAGALAMVSSGRCARVSYLTHGGERDITADFGLFSKLLGNGHMSPHEHPASVGEISEGYWATLDQHGVPSVDLEVPVRLTEAAGQRWAGDFVGNLRAPWVQLRKTLPNEDVFVSDPPAPPDLP